MMDRLFCFRHTPRRSREPVTVDVFWETDGLRLRFAAVVGALEECSNHSWAEQADAIPPVELRLLFEDPEAGLIDAIGDPLSEAIADAASRFDGSTPSHAFVTFSVRHIVTERQLLEWFLARLRMHGPQSALSSLQEYCATVPSEPDSDKAASLQQLVKLIAECRLSFEASDHQSRICLIGALIERIKAHSTSDPLCSFAKRQLGSLRSARQSRSRESEELGKRIRAALRKLRGNCPLQSITWCRLRLAEQSESAVGTTISYRTVLRHTSGN
jgi:hypothetical protein